MSRGEIVERLARGAKDDGLVGDILGGLVLVGLQRRSLGWGKHAVEATQHSEREDNAAALGLFEVLHIVGGADVEALSD